MSSEGNLVWHDTVDNKAFRVSVRSYPDNSYKGRLRVEVTSTGSIILDKEVGISNEGLFGPDHDDLFLWSNDAIEAIDGYLESLDSE